MPVAAWHADGPHLFEQGPTLPAHALNVFLPLVDLTAQNGPTQFAPGSHVRGQEHAGGGVGSEFDEGEADGEDGEGSGKTRTFFARSGDAIIFDYRVRRLQSSRGYKRA